jgi:hypothetical protein
MPLDEIAIPTQALLCVFEILAVRAHAAALRNHHARLVICRVRSFLPDISTISTFGLIHEHPGVTQLHASLRQ